MEILDKLLIRAGRSKRTFRTDCLGFRFEEVHVNMCSKIFRTIFGIALAFSCCAGAKAQMMTCLPGEQCGSIPTDVLLTKEDYITSVLSHWAPSQVQAWQ